MCANVNNTVSTQNLKVVVKDLLLHYVIVLAAASIIALFLLQTAWIGRIDLFHTVLELACIFIAMSVFFIIWYTHDIHPVVNRIIGFGFLAVAILMLMHVYLSLYPLGNMNLSARYGVISRVIEAIAILLSTQRCFDKKKTNKWRSLFITIVCVTGVSYIVLYFSGSFPSSYAKRNLNNFEIVLTYFTICLLLISLYKLRRKITSKDVITYRYIFLAILVEIPVNVCLIFFTDINSFYYVLAHNFRIVAYYYIFKGVFVSGISYPYEKLKESNDYLRTILDKLPIAFTSYNSDHILSYANRKALEILEYDLEDIKGLSARQMADRLYPKEAEIKQPFTEQIDELTGPIKNKLLTLINKQGKRIKVRADIHKLDNGEYLYLFDDATKEQELENLQLQTKTILSAISSCVAVVDRNGRIVILNKAYQEILEMREEDVLGVEVEKLNEMIQYSSKECPQKVLEGSEFKGEVSFVTPSGKKKELLLYSTPILNIENEIIGAIGVGTDITDFKKEQQKLIQQEKLALLGQLGAGIVHETKNFLTTIKGSSQLLNLVATDEKTKRCARKIDNAVNEVNAIISGFLSLAKPKQTVFNEASMNALILSMQTMLESSSLIKGVDINIRLISEDRPVLLDESQIKQVVLNISKNAIEAMTEVEKPVLDITTGFDEMSREMFIKITDNGKGISEQDKEKLGIPFFTTKERGTGLGLNVCFQIIKEHGGRIDVESELGRGTSFVISLPVKELRKEMLKSVGVN